MDHRIKHVFVLMMENRSFDHFFAYSNLFGSPYGDSLGMKPNAENPNPDLDLPHEFEHVQFQITGPPPMFGFRKQQSPYDVDSMQGFNPAKLPVTMQLANNFVLFDNWFSSMPGPTWPNRFFVHAASSGGLDNSPMGWRSLMRHPKSFRSLTFEFQNGTIFDRLTNNGYKWRIYHGDWLPQVLAINGMASQYIRSRIYSGPFIKYRDSDFVSDLNSDYDISYTFIEPQYGLSSNFKEGNSQHLTGQVAPGEQLIKEVYEAIRNSPVWETSLLIVTYDEHGGFFDHIEPPICISPGDLDWNRHKAEDPQNFDFKRLGVRVPTLAISPWLGKGKQSTALYDKKGEMAFDHTSIIHTLRDIFDLGNPLTKRDGSMPSMLGLLLDRRREDTPSELVSPNSVETNEAQDSNAANEGPDTTLFGFMRIAMSLELLMNRTDQAIVPFFQEYGVADFQTVQAIGDYIENVADKVAAFRERNEERPA